MRLRSFITTATLLTLPLLAAAAPAPPNPPKLDGAGGAATPAPVPVTAPDPKALEFFEAKIRPLLSEQCFACHTGASARGKLSLRSREAMLAGGELGPALVPGDPDKSLLIRAVRYETEPKMPPKGKLSAQQIQDLTDWVKQGAVWPAAGKGSGFRVQGSAGGGAASTAPGTRTPAVAKPHWAFQPVATPKIPTVKAKGWVKTPIDAFVLATLEKQGLKPNGWADRHTLIRRATFDLTGLPPAPEEVEAFMADKSPDAWPKVIDRLLASPAYGERWARHWLDVARYADTNGQDENIIFGNAYRYRDYVVQALNADKPWDQFIREQLAGDLLPAATEAEKRDHLIATGFLVMGPKVLAEPDKPKLIMDVVDEQIDVTTRGFMGVTVSCARCHDHKFDPIPTKDYYGLAGIYKSTTTFHSDQGIVSRWNERVVDAPEVVAAREAYNASVKALQQSIKDAKEPAEKTRLQEELKARQAKAPPAPAMAMAVEDGKVENVRVHIRGNHLTLGDEVPRHFLTLASREPSVLDEKRSGRLELANWIASPSNPLTARVLVNRVWEHHFGRGLVGTPDNFGKLGEAPTHPELLDWLARDFVSGEGSGFRVQGSGAAPPNPPKFGGAGGARPWSLKRLHRLIMLSAAYGMSSEYNAVAATKDPEDRLLWRMNRQRLEAEAIRDAMLAASGQLDRTMGGMGLSGKSGYATNDQSGNVGQYVTNRRSIYLPVVRNAVYDMFQVFDFVDPSVLNGHRAMTTVAPQALFLMNSPFAAGQAKHLAELLLALPGTDDPHRVDAAYRRALGRPATPAETARALRYIQAVVNDSTGKESEKARLTAWQTFCQALFASNEFVYVN
jgi:hypothetical protein